MHWFPISNLPGESARASLKHARYRRASGGRSRSPGRIGPGLIEAWMFMLALAEVSAISRANRPGPH